MSKMILKTLSGLAVSTLVLSFSLTPAFAADYGSGAVSEGETYSVEDMLTYAIQDEYMARAVYNNTMDAFGVQRPFSNIVNAENVHVELLTPLLEKYGVSVPEDEAIAIAPTPASIQEALDAGVQAEISNIAMYEEFLAQSPPEDIADVFTYLIAASKNHQSAFERVSNRTGSGSLGLGRVGAAGRRGQSGGGTGVGNAGRGGWRW